MESLAARPPLAPRTVELWWSAIDLPPAVLTAMRAELDDATTARIELLVRPDDRRRATVAHALLRRRVAALLAVAPADVTVVRRCAVCGATDHGKPAVAARAGAPAPPEINLAHAGALAVVALSTAGPVGVDVERERPEMDWESHHAHVFDDAEWDATRRSHDPGAARLAAWTRKEAAAKATGHGIAVGLERVRVGDPPRDQGWRAVTLPDDLGPVRVRDVHLAPGYAAAVAVGGSGAPPVLTVCQAEA